MVFDNFLAERQSNSRSGLLLQTVQALKDGEYLIFILVFEANAVIPEYQLEISLIGIRFKLCDEFFTKHRSGGDSDERFLSAEL